MAINQNISTLPAAPSRSDSPSDFSDKADAFLAALPTLQTELNTYAGEANSTETAIDTSETNAATSEQNAQDWATDLAGLVVSTDYSAKAYAVSTNLVPDGSSKEWSLKTDGSVDTTEFSAKAYALGGTGVTDVTGAAKEWAVKTGTTVDGSDYSAKDYAISLGTINDGSAKEWAVNTGGTVDATEYSSKDYASSQNLISTGSSKDWAIKTGSTVDGTEFSAKKYASDAEASASAAAATANAEAWSAGVTYDTNDAAIGSDGNTYRSLVDGNLGNDPVLGDGNNWLSLTEAPVKSVSGKTGEVSLNSSDVGLENVPNEDATNPENWDQDGASDGDQLKWDGTRWVTFTPENGGYQAVDSSTVLTWHEANKRNITGGTYFTVFDINSPVELVFGSLYAETLGFRLTVDGTVIANRTSKEAGATPGGQQFSTISLGPVKAESSMKLELYAIESMEYGWRVATR